jgi:hypothetical protein
MHTIAPLFLPMLLAWSVLWTALAAIGLFRRNASDRMRGFWLTNALWVCVNTAIGVVALLDPPADAAEFVRLLWINAGLDVLYLLIGVILITRRPPIARGVGAAILVQGAFLLILDVAWALALSS